MGNILLFPFKLIFYFAVSIKNWCYDIGLCKKYTFDIPIISIGNIAFGGTGKTPMVIHLCEKIKKEGYNPAVISRGYKRKSTGLIVVNDGSGTLESVQDSGDEPYLISKKIMNIPVIVCNKREQAAEYIIKNLANVNVILLDDGFQYRKLHRMLDIVLLNGSECSTILREPKSSLNRADIVLTLDKNYSISEFKDNTLNPSIPDEGVYAFCGIAYPNSFFKFIKDSDIEVKGKSIFEDHHGYSTQSIKKLQNLINKSNANSIITTEKDLVKLPDEFLKQYKTHIVIMNIIFENNTFYKDVLNCIRD